MFIPWAVVNVLCRPFKSQNQTLPSYKATSKTNSNYNQMAFVSFDNLTSQI